MVSSTLKIWMQTFYEPKLAFEALKSKPPVWLPLLSLTLLTAAVLFWYMKTVDFPWLVERIVSAESGAKPEAREAMRHLLSPGFMTLSTVGSSLLGMPIMFAMYALYYWIASKLMDSNIGYAKWFAFSVWISVPALLALPLMALQIVTGHGQVAIEDLSMLSLNFLLLHLAPDNMWASLVNSLSLTTIWSTILSIIGLLAWTGRSVVACTFASLLPLLVFYGIWAGKIIIFH